MRILGIVGSPRIEGNTEIMVKEALDAARQRGAQTELVLAAEHDVNPCNGCMGCTESGECIIEDDMQGVYEKLEQCNGLIFGTPVYFINVSAQAKAMIDRSLSFMIAGKMKGKVAAAVVVARRVGAGQVLSLLYTWFAAQRMIIAGGALGYGRDRGEVRDGPGGAPMLTALEEARALGRNVVGMIKRLS
jgi:multimeric flavodoxin WrbA